MKILVTGATGFLGSHLCRRLLAEGHSVRALSRPNANRSKVVGLAIEFAEGDVTDPTAVLRATTGCELVIHAAANLAYWRGTEAAQTRVNVDGTRNVAEAARSAGVRRMVQVSSTAAVGIPEDPSCPANEDFPFNLGNSGLNYHISKRRAEEEVLAAVDRGLDAVIVNPASIHSIQRGIDLLAKVRANRIVTYFGGGNCFVHVDDVVSGILAAAARGESGQRYILGGENLTFRAAAEEAAGLLGLARRFVRVPRAVTYGAAVLLEPLAQITNRPPRISRLVHYCANRFQYYDSGKARRFLGYAPRDFGAILEEALHLHREGSDSRSS